MANPVTGTAREGAMMVDATTPPKVEHIVPGDAYTCAHCGEKFPSWRRMYGHWIDEHGAKLVPGGPDE